MYKRDREITPFQLAIYGVWLCADVLALKGFAWAGDARVVGEVLYYGVFTWFVAWRLQRR